MTELTFLNDSYLKELETSIENVTSIGIITKETIFYPRSGGQDQDKGYIEWNGQKIEIKDVEKIGKEVHLIIGEHEIIKGNKVHLFIDWQRKHKFMRYHTAAHILSAVVYKETKALITGNNIDENKGRIDFNLEEFDREKINEWAKKANEIVKENHDVKIYSLDREEAMKIDSIFRLKDVLPKNLVKFRIVEVEKVDKQACGGTHVKNTSEIGTINVLKVQNKGKNNRRLYFQLE